MKRFLTIFAAAAALLVAGCQKAEVEDNLNIGSTTIVVSNAGATQDIVFTANTDWTIASDQAWVTFDREKGVAGKVTVTLTIAANETTDDRTAKVTVKAGSKETVFTIEQKAVTGFASSIEYKIDEKAQDITIGVAYNVDYTVTVGEDSPWLTVTKTKAAPQEGAIVIHAAANSQLGPRVGTFTIAGAGFEQVYSVVQSAAWTPAVKAEGIYLSNGQNPWDDIAWRYLTIQQYAVKLTTEEGNVVTIVLNRDGFTVDTETGAESGEYFAEDAIPAGEYELDAEGTMADGTFATKGDLSRWYYSSITIDGRVVDAVDGAVSVAVEDGRYTVTAALIDAAGSQYNYSYEGPIEVTPVYYGRAYSCNYKNTYNTAMASKANEWYFDVQPARGADPVKPKFVSINFYSAAGEVDKTKLPMGTYTFAESETITSSSKNGNLNAQPGTFDSASFTVYDSDDNYTIDPQKPATMTLSANDDGSTHVELTGTFTTQVTTGEGDDAKTETISKEVSLAFDIDFGTPADNQSYPMMDDEPFVVVSAMPAYFNGWWYGDPFKTGGTTVMIGFTAASTAGGSGVVIYLWIDLDKEVWPFEANAGTRCITPIPDGTYSYSTTPKHGALIPAYATATNSCYFTNSYTGTKFWINGGSFTITDDKRITFDITGKSSSGISGKLEGGIDLSPNPFGTTAFISNRSANEGTVKLQIPE